MRRYYLVSLICLISAGLFGQGTAPVLTKQEALRLDGLTKRLQMKLDERGGSKQTDSNKERAKNIQMALSDLKIQVETEHRGWTLNTTTKHLEPK